MDHRELLDYALSKNGTYTDFPFGDYPVCVKVKGKLFYQGYDTSRFNLLTLKCEPELAILFREQYPDVVVRGYHCPLVQQPFWNTIHLDDNIVPAEQLCAMIDHAYEVVLAKLSVRDREILLSKATSTKED